MALGLGQLVDTLRATYPDAVLPPLLTDPVELLLWEAVAYLVDDARRAAAFDALRVTVGTRPEDILAAPPEAIEAVTTGMRPAARAERVRDIAALAADLLGPDPLETLRALPTRKALGILRKFPGTGTPGAEKVLLFAGIAPILALESNGLRVLLRTGFGEPDNESYDRAYASVRRAVEPEIEGRDTDWLITAHRVLRAHGQALCRRSQPACAACPVAKACPSAPSTRTGHVATSPW